MLIERPASVDVLAPSSAGVFVGLTVDDAQEHEQFLTQARGRFGESTGIVYRWFEYDSLRRTSLQHRHTVALVGDERSGGALVVSRADASCEVRMLASGWRGTAVTAVVPAEHGFDYCPAGFIGDDGTVGVVVAGNDARIVRVGSQGEAAPPDALGFSSWNVSEVVDRGGGKAIFYAPDGFGHDDLYVRAVAPALGAPLRIHALEQGRFVTAIGAASFPSGDTIVAWADHDPFVGDSYRIGHIVVDANGRAGAPSYRLAKGVIDHVAVATSDDVAFVGWFEDAGETGEARLMVQRTDTRAAFDGPATEMQRFARSGRVRLLASGTRAAADLRVLAAYGAPRSWDADSPYRIGLRAMACSR